MRYTSERGEIQRAPYALPRGLSALQFDLGKGLWTLVIVVIAILVLAVPVSFLAGRHTSPEAQLQRRMFGELSELERVWARTVAIGPIQDLIQGYVTFLSVVEMNEDDPAIWLGVERLAREGLIARTPAMLLMRDRVLFTLSKCTPPDDYSQIFRTQSLLAGG